MGEEPKIRRLTAADISPALELSTQAGWNQTADDWRTLIELAPQSCLAIEVDGELASTGILICYGKRLAWLGMVLTKIRFRGRGFAKRLLSEALNLADQMKIETVKLDATDQGKPLYERLGFRSEQAVERWERPGGGSSNEHLAGETSLSGELLSVDEAAFGANRLPLLTKLAERSSPVVTTNSYLLARPGTRTTYLGPCVSDDAQVARSSIENWVRTRTDALSWDLLEANHAAEAIAKELGFTTQRHLTRMVRGRDLRGREESIYALAGFEFG